jgi:hypothetical protein
LSDWDVPEELVEDPDVPEDPDVLDVPPEPVLPVGVAEGVWVVVLPPVTGVVSTEGVFTVATEPCWAGFVADVECADGVYGCVRAESVWDAVAPERC